MLMRHNFGGFFALLLCIVTAPASVIKAQVAEPKVELCRAGARGVTAPQCLPCSQSKFSNAARTANVSGIVLLDVTVTADGRVTNPIVIKGPGLGLEEKALEKVRSWKMRAALGPGGKAVSCRVQIEVTLHLY